MWTKEIKLDKPSRERVRKILKKDPKLLRLKVSFRDLPQYNLDFDELKAEMRLLHSQRKLHRMSPNDPNFLRHMNEAAILDHSFRTRLTEIYVMGVEANTLLSKTLKSMVDYLINEYANDLAKLRTKEERNQFVVGIMEPYYEYLTDAEQLLLICKSYFDNIDKGGFMVRDLVSAHQVIRKFEGNT